MRFRHYAAVAAMILFVSVNLNAQFMPVTAKVRTVEETIRNGKVVKQQTKEGNYYRASDGSFLRRWTSIDGNERAAMLANGELLDNRTATFYKLDYENLRAYAHEKFSESISAARGDDEVTKNLPVDSVEGVPCKLQPVKLRRRNGSLEDVGQACFSVEYRLTLRRQMTYRLENGDTFHSAFQLFDIHVGAEPDRNLFDLQKNFTVFRPDHP